jgi:hypothetical protein
MDVKDKTIINLVSKEGKKVPLECFAAKRSIFVTDILMDDLANKDDDGVNITIDEAKYDCLLEIVDYLNYYAEKEPVQLKKPIQTNETFEKHVNQWDFDFVMKNKDLHKIHDLICIADFMRIAPLHELLCCYVAFVMKDLGTAQAIIDHFGIELDMTEEEMRQLEKEQLEGQTKRKEEEFEKRRHQQEEEYKKIKENEEELLKCTNSDKKDKEEKSHDNIDVA